MQDDTEAYLTRIITKVTQSGLSDTEKADILTELSLGMRKLVWPILLSHVPPYLMQVPESRAGKFTMDDYAEIIHASLSNPATAIEIHDELNAALEEVEQLVTKTIS